MQIFLKFTNLYYRFIHGFSDIVYFLFDIITSSGFKVYIFTTLKVAITTALILASSNISTLFRIKVDSLDFITEVVLFYQSKKDNKWYSIVFFSKLLFIVEYNYNIYNKEMLAVT